MLVFRIFLKRKLLRFTIIIKKIRLMLIRIVLVSALIVLNIIELELAKNIKQITNGGIVNE